MQTMHDGEIGLFGFFMGNVNVNVVPYPTLLSTVIPEESRRDLY
jgi:hypothetical protein